MRIERADSSTTARRELKYDDVRGGVLAAERVTQREVSSGGGGGGGGGTTGADRSWVYTYDGLSRLQSAANGPLNTAWAFDTSNTKRLEQSWALDDLANWLGSGTPGDPEPFTPGLREQRFDPATGLVTGEEAIRRHIVSPRQEIITQARARLDHSSSPPTLLDAFDSHYGYDPAGRMVFDGTVLYEYDGFGRLVQVREVVGGLAANADGSYTVPASGVAALGRLIAHYTYDAFGRVVRTQRLGGTGRAAGGAVCVHAGWGGAG